MGNFRPLSADLLLVRFGVGIHSSFNDLAIWQISECETAKTAAQNLSTRRDSIL
jgi:hypothetical protein